MRQKTIIKQILAFCVLIVFTISISPKLYFHEAIADHKDDVACMHTLEKSKTCLHENGFKCDVNSLVVATSFITMQGTPCIIVPKVFVDRQCVFSPVSAQFCFTHKESRGPPAV